MLLKYFQDLLNTDWRLTGFRRILFFPAVRAEIAGGSEGDDSARGRRRRSEEEAFLRQRKDQEDARNKEREEREENDFLILALIASEEGRRLCREISESIADARRAVRRAYESAIEDERLARIAIEEARRNALTLPDGRRVYFSRSGDALYAEDGRLVTDDGTLREARRLRGEKPDATSYEDYAARIRASDLAAQRVERLGAALERLDQIEERIKRGGVTDEELVNVRWEMEELLASLPPDAGEEYRRLRTSRENHGALRYRAVDPAFATGPDLAEDFRRASDALAANIEAASAAPDQPARPPAYRAAPPDF